MRKLVRESNRKYVVVKEPDYTFSRLRKSDNNDIKNLLVLWEGNNLRKGYDAMIEINKEEKSSRTRFFVKVQNSGVLKVLKCEYPDLLEYPWYEVSFCEAENTSKSTELIKKNWECAILRLKNKEKISYSKKITLSDLRYLCWKHKEDPELFFLPK